MNNSVSDNLGRADTELEIVFYQVEICLTVSREKEAEIVENRKQEEEIKKRLKKATEDKTSFHILKRNTDIELDKTNKVIDDVAESLKLLAI